MSNHPITPLTSGQVNHDHLSVELVEPDGMPAADPDYLAERADDR